MQKISKFHGLIFGFLILMVTAGVFFIPNKTLAVCNLTIETLPLCNSCSPDEHCLVGETDYGICIEVPEGTEPFTLPDGRIINTDDKVCRSDEDDTTSLPCIVRTVAAGCDQCSAGATCYLNGEPAGTCTERDGAKICSAASSSSKKAFTIPDLTVRIPGLTLSKVRTIRSADGLYQLIEIPWMADYIVAAYRFSVFLGAMLAIILIMIGGIQWLTASGDASRVGAAQKRISNAVVGFLLIVGSYLVLTTINPDLTQLNPLRVKEVIGDPYEPKNVLSNTTENTAGPLRLP